MMIDLKSELTFRNCFCFPLQSGLSRKEVLWGGILVLIPFLRWIMNMGHRIEMVHRMHQGLPAWPSWLDYRRLLKSGTMTFLGMVYYYLPGAFLLALSRLWRSGQMGLAAALFILIATLAVPGYMTHYCRNYDAREIFNPFRALGRAMQGGALYWKAWAIALAALAVSFLGLLALGIGFLFTSVWFWQVAGFSFALVFSRRFALVQPAGSDEKGAVVSER